PVPPRKGAEPRRPGRGWRPQRIVPIVVLVVLLVAAGTAAFAAASATGPRARVPNLVGMGQQAARGAADRARVGVRFRTVPSDDPAPVEVPNGVGETYDEASKALTAKRFKVSRVDEYSDTVPAGQVIRHTPVKGAEAPRDSTVTVVVSKGPDLVTVDDYRGE